MAFLGEEIKKLGFGMMRLPQKDGKIDVEETKKMVDLYMKAGFTYFDTAFCYGGSEDATRQALVERYPRESFQLATKLSAWLNCNSKEDCYKQFETSLKQRRIRSASDKLC
ncbi:aldo/keto reductase [Treponema sp.]|uniref:aldo/keto reductase n=1 Tax=Treponema sp. TaxID=166 RepID=UPI00298DBD73|nr:aldo/keto reductase [Treponema sp.]MCQ2240169.1 aldo/keto reductase [Treponema sp.]